MYAIVKELMLQINDTQDTDTGQFQAKTIDYTQHLRSVIARNSYSEYESSMLLPSDQQLLQTVQKLSQEKANSDLRYHIVVGIGGSNLGTKAVYDALHGFADVLEPQRSPKLLFAETTDPTWLTKASALLDTIENPEQVLVSVISKSGGTTETMANFEIIMQVLGQKFQNATDRVVAITDEGSPLWQQAGEKQIDRLAIPKPVGGRYSVLSAVGLFPLATVGIDIASLCKGAATMRDSCLTENNNIAAHSAALLAAQQQTGKTINDNFFFHIELESLGKWYRQLMGESVGKAQSLSGEEVHIGITPTVSLGSTDLHSVGQLYLGGPKDKFTTFVYTNHAIDIGVPRDGRVFPELLPMIAGKSAREILKAILDGVKIAYQKAGLPYMEIVLDDISERSLGEYLQFKMLEMMYLGQFLNVNAFDQPSVESYKIETKKILEK